MNKQLDTKKGIGCAFLFALPFALVGLFMGGWVGLTLWEAWQIEGWVETPAEILEAKLERHSGDGSDTFEATARYAYTFNGKRYECDRVALHSGSDNIGKFQQRLGDKLQRHLQEKRPIACYVNPQQPSEAIIDRDWRLGLLTFKSIFAVVFGGVGFGIMAAVWYSARGEQREQSQLESEPDRPWLTRPDWAAGHVRSRHWKTLLGSWAITLFWNGISWTVALAFLLGEDKVPFWISVFVWFFPVVGVLLLFGALLHTLRFLLYRSSEFEMAQVPGVIGGRLTGVVRVPVSHPPSEGFWVTLTCLDRRIDRSSDGRSVYYDPIWQSDKHIARTLREPTKEGTAVPVDFYIPYHCRPTKLPDSVRWQLAVWADLPWANYHTEFDVPVFKTEASSDASPAPSELLSEYESPITVEQIVKRCGGEIRRQTEHSLQLYFGCKRRLGSAIASTVFAVVWWTVSIGLLYSDVPWFFAIIFCLSAVGLTFGVFWMWGERVHIRCDTGELSHRGGIFGLGRQRQFSADEIVAIEARNSGSRSSSASSGTIVYQEIRLRCRGPKGKKRKLLGGIKRRADAEGLAKVFRERVGLQANEVSDGETDS